MEWMQSVWKFSFKFHIIGIPNSWNANTANDMRYMKMESIDVAHNQKINGEWKFMEVRIVWTTSFDICYNEKGNKCLILVVHNEWNHPGGYGKTGF